MRVIRTLTSLCVAFAGDSIVALLHVAELDALCVPTLDGRLVLLHDADGTADEVGTVEAGVVVAAWSPDEELLAIVTGGAQLLLMSKVWVVVQDAHRA